MKAACRRDAPGETRPLDKGFSWTTRFRYRDCRRRESFLYGSWGWTARGTRRSISTASCRPISEGRARRFSFARDASRFRRFRPMQRFGLALYLHKTPLEIRLTRGCRGKPRLAEGLGASFKVAHPDGLGLLAFAAAGEVDIDL
jgi:phosphopantetheinyl transferase